MMGDYTGMNIDSAISQVISGEDVAGVASGFLGDPLSEAEREWMGEPPDKCDICGDRVFNHFVDGKIRGRSTWATMCLDCHAAYGAGLGTGMGQMYSRRGDRWIKVDG